MDQKTELERARERVAQAIDDWKEKADINCGKDTYYHRVGVVARLFGTLVATGSLQAVAKGVQLPTWLSLGLTVLVLVVAAYDGYAGEMSKKHAYGERWPRIRAALDGMIADRDAELVGAVPFAGLGDTDRAGLLMRRCSAWIARARGMAPQAPIPER
jgi:hypothetical protein